MLLHHFTTEEGWVRVLRTGEIQPRWRFDRRSELPALIHLTASHERASLSHGLQDRSIRITADLPDGQAEHWRSWGRRLLPPDQGISLGYIDPWWAPTADPRGEKGRPTDWWVSELAIPSRQWTEVVNVDTGACLWPETT